MTPEQLQAIEERWNSPKMCVHPEALKEINRLLAEVRRLQAENEQMRCCGNCHYFMRNPQNCAGCVTGSKWEAEDNG